MYQPSTRALLFCLAALLCHCTAVQLLAQVVPGTFVDIDSSNTVPLGAESSPFFTDSSADTGFTAGSLYLRRSGFGMTAYVATGNLEVFQKDFVGFGDAYTLVTTVTGLVPNQSYGVYVAFISVASESWRVKAGLTAGSLEQFTPTSPTGRITSLGLSGESGSNRTQYLGYIANATASPTGTLTLYSKDGDHTTTNGSTRTWLEGFLLGAPITPPEPPALPGGAVEINSDGAWTWFNDERAIFHNGSLFSGYVKADGRYGITRRNLSTGSNAETIISTATSAEQDDHNNPSLTVLPDGKLLTLYSKHGGESRFYRRTSLNTAPNSLADWSSEVQIATPAGNTYCNTYRLSSEGNTLYNFSRCLNYNPCLMRSFDNGNSWQTMQHFILTGTGGTRPYARYCSDDSTRVDMIYTDGHPRNQNNSLYHLYCNSNGIYRTDASLIDTMANLPLEHDSGQRGSVIYTYSAAAWGAGQGPDDWIPTGRAWNWDIHYAADGRPIVAFQVQRDNVTGAVNGTDDRIYYYYARWTGSSWQRRFIAQGGRPLYAAEDDYGGGMCLDPVDPRIVYISSNAASPFQIADTTSVPLGTNQRYEIYRGLTTDGGLTFSWTPITQNSAADNLRPIIPKDHPNVRDLLWFYGTYTTYTNFSARVIASFGDTRQQYEDWASTHAASAPLPNEDPDQDALPNLLEYATQEGSALPALAGSSYQVRIHPQRTDIEWVIESSTDLVQWTTAAILRAGGLESEVDAAYSLSFNSDANPLATLSAQPGTFGSKGFYRLRVTKLW